MSTGEATGQTTGSYTGSTGTLVGAKPVITDISGEIDSADILVNFNYRIDTTSDLTTGFVINLNGVAQTIDSVSGDGLSSSLTYTIATTLAVNDTINLVYTQSSGGIFGRVTAIVMEDRNVSFSIPVAPASGIFFYDDFSTGAPTKTNSEGFDWKGDNGNALFNSQGMIYKDAEGGVLSPPLSSYNSGTGWAWAKDANSLWESKVGSNFMNFVYTPGKAWCERRFNLGTVHADVWVKYWCRVPTNFNYPTPTSGINNKWFDMWMDAYSAKGAGSSVILELTPNTALAGGCRIDLSYSPGQVGKSAGAKNSNFGERHYKNDPRDHFVPSHQNKTPWCSSADQGRWMQVVIHFQAQTSVGQFAGDQSGGDGVIQVYRKWEDDSLWSTILNYQNAAVKLPESGTQGFINGYFFGHANTGFTEQTEWLIDEVTFSTSSLL